MEDIEVPDGGEGGGPVSPEAEELPSEGETATSDGDAPAEETEDGQQQEEGDESSPAEGSGGAFDKLLAKYGGDREKMATAYFEQANSNSRLWEKLQGIEEYIKGQQQAPKVDEAELVAEDPDVKEIVKDYNDTQAEVRAATTKQDQLISQFGKLESDINRLRGKLEASNDPDVKLELREELNEKVGEQKSIRSEIGGIQRDVRQLNSNLKDLTRRYREAEERAKAQVSRQRQLTLERQQEAQATRREFADAMRTEANRYGIPVESKQYAILFQSVNDRIYSYLSKLPAGSPGVDLTGAVGALMAEYAELANLKAKFQKASDVKRAAAGAGPKPTQANAPRVPEKVVAPPKDGRWSKAFVDERAKRMLGG